MWSKMLKKLSYSFISNLWSVEKIFPLSGSVPDINKSSIYLYLIIIFLLTHFWENYYGASDCPVCPPPHWERTCSNRIIMPSCTGERSPIQWCAQYTASISGGRNTTRCIMLNRVKCRVQCDNIKCTSKTMFV